MIIIITIIIIIITHRVRIGIDFVESQNDEHQLVIATDASVIIKIIIIKE